eukprot:5109373-Pyramimonas_sp.AAC.1
MPPCPPGPGATSAAPARAARRGVPGGKARAFSGVSADLPGDGEVVVHALEAPEEVEDAEVLLHDGGREDGGQRHRGGVLQREHVPPALAPRVRHHAHALQQTHTHTHTHTHA